MAPKFQTVDEYIASFPPEVQIVLGQVRRTVREAAPDALEKISYQMPTFTLFGKYLVYFSAWKSHIGMYGLSDALEAFEEQLAPYAGEKGSLKFPLSQPMPLGLIRDIVRFQAGENAEKAKPKKSRARP